MKIRALVCVVATVVAAFSSLQSAVAVAATSPNTAGSFSALSPQRILDTRIGLGAGGAVGPGQSIAVQVLGQGGIPSSGVLAVLLTVTETGASAGGWITIWAHGAPRPYTSSLNFEKLTTVANSVVVPVGADGTIDLFNGSGAGIINLLADVQGYYSGGATPSMAGTFQPVVTSRLLDTRSGLGAAPAPVPGKSAMSFFVAGTGGVPVGASAVALNLTVTNTSGRGFITAYPGQTPLPPTSNLNFVGGQTVANMVVVPVGNDGHVNLYNGAAGSVALVADVLGYYLGGNAGALGTLALLPLQRIFDTRTTQPRSILAARGTTTLQVSGAGGIPTSGVAAVAINVTVINPAAAGYLSVYPAGITRPRISNMNFLPVQTVANLVVVPVGASGSITLYNGSGGPMSLAVDVVGLFWDGSGAARCNSIAADPAGTAVSRWDPVVACILEILGQPVNSSNVSDVESIISHESSGDPNAINNYDSNFKAGHPSEGLIQVIRPTFNEYRSTQLPNDLLNPAANLYAGLNYAITDYGSIHNVPGLVSLRNGGGYKGYVTSR